MLVFMFNVVCHSVLLLKFGYYESEHYTVLTVLVVM